MDLRILSDDELLALAGEINLELLRRVPVKAEMPAAETPAVLPTRCPHCGGTGWRTTTAEFCSCAMGRDLQRAEKGALSRFAPADLKYSSPEPDYAKEPEEEEEGS